MTKAKTIATALAALTLAAVAAPALAEGPRIDSSSREVGSLIDPNGREVGSSIDPNGREMSSCVDPNGACRGRAAMPGLWARLLALLNILR